MFEQLKYISSGKYISRGKWKHPDRIIDSYELIFVIKGKVFINEDGIEYELCENDILFLEPGVRHYGFKESSDTSFYWLHWSNYEHLPQYKKQKIENTYNLSLLFNQLLHYSMENFFPETLDYITRLIVADVYSDSIKSSKNKIVNTVSEWIKANKDINISVNEVAKHFGYNPDYLSRLFKKQYEINLKEYIDKIKLQFIKKELLNTNKTLKEISDSCGFSEYKYFLKFFKYHENMTPTEFSNVYSKTHINNK